MKNASWGLIVKAIKKVGKDKVYKALEKEHLVWMGMQAELYADPETLTQANKMQEQMLQQEITLAKIKHYQ